MNRCIKVYATTKVMGYWDQTDVQICLFSIACAYDILIYLIITSPEYQQHEIKKQRDENA